MMATRDGQVRSEMCERCSVDVGTARGGQCTRCAASFSPGELRVSAVVDSKVGMWHLRCLPGRRAKHAVDYGSTLVALEQEAHNYLDEPAYLESLVRQAFRCLANGERLPESILRFRATLHPQKRSPVVRFNLLKKYNTELVEDDLKDLMSSVTTGNYSGCRYGDVELDKAAVARLLAAENTETTGARAHLTKWLKKRPRDGCSDYDPPCPEGVGHGRF